MNKYENHEDEWREDENRLRYERDQSRRQRWIDPRDPDYIAPEEPEETEECPTCVGSGFSGHGTGYDAVCDTCAGRREVLKNAE